MDFETMLKLVNAGFTKEDIMKLSIPTTPTEPATPTEPDKPTEPANDVISQLTTQITDLANIVKDMQNNNVKNAKMDSLTPTNALDAVKSFFGDVSLKEGK
jgi:hypothetical protein